MQIHIRFAEIAVIQSHRIHMYLRLDIRTAEKASYVRLTGKQTVEHDDLYRQDKWHHIRCIHFLQIDRKGICSTA